MKWNKCSEAKPTEEKQYLCLNRYGDNNHFYILHWVNDLYEFDKYDFYDSRGKHESGFVDYDSEWGWCQIIPEYWTEIEWSKDNE